MGNRAVIQVLGPGEETTRQAQIYVHTFSESEFLECIRLTLADRFRHDVFAAGLAMHLISRHKRIVSRYPGDITGIGIEPPTATHTDLDVGTIFVHTGYNRIATVEFPGRDPVTITRD